MVIKMTYTKTVNKHNEAEALVELIHNDVTITGMQFSRVLDEKCRIIKDPVKMAEEFCRKHPNYVIVSCGQFTITCATKKDAEKIGVKNAKPTMY